MLTYIGVHAQCCVSSRRLNILHTGHHNSELPLDVFIGVCTDKLKRANYYTDILSTT